MFENIRLRTPEIPCDSPLEYEGFIRELSEKCIQEKSREWFRTSASLNTMEENLQVAGTYSFNSVQC